MKKFLALLLALVMAFSLVACGGDKTPADDQQGDNNGDSQYPEYFAGMDQLIADAQAEGELTVYGSCEEEYLTAACQHFEELFGIKVNAQRLSTGEVQAKIEEENGNPSADVWFGGTTDPYNVCAAEGLLEPYAATNASHLIDDMYKDADGNWYGIYKGILGFMVNTDELTRMGLEAPADWTDLLKDEYKGLIWLSNYNTAGTAKLVVNTMIQKYGHDEGIKYLVDLDKNIEVYTKSGSGPSSRALPTPTPPSCGSSTLCPPSALSWLPRTVPISSWSSTTPSSPLRLPSSVWIPTTSWLMTLRTPRPTPPPMWRKS